MSEETRHDDDLDGVEDLAARPGFPEGLRALHPALLEALNNPMARAEVEAVLANKDGRPEDLNSVIPYINPTVSHIVGGLEDPTAYFHERAGADIIRHLTGYGNHMGATTGLRLILIALNTFAKTKLWEAVQPNKEFTPENYTRCSTIMQIIKDILAGPHVGANVGGGGN